MLILVKVVCSKNFNEILILTGKSKWFWNFSNGCSDRIPTRQILHTYKRKRYFCSHCATFYLQHCSTFFLGILSEKQMVVEFHSQQNGTQNGYQRKHYLPITLFHFTAFCSLYSIFQIFRSEYCQRGRWQRKVLQQFHSKFCS